MREEEEEVERESKVGHVHFSSVRLEKVQRAKERKTTKHVMTQNHTKKVPFPAFPILNKH